MLEAEIEAAAVEHSLAFGATDVGNSAMSRPVAPPHHLLEEEGVETGEEEVTEAEEAKVTHL